MEYVQLSSSTIRSYTCVQRSCTSSRHHSSLIKTNRDRNGFSLSKLYLFCRFFHFHTVKSSKYILATESVYHYGAVSVQKDVGWFFLGGVTQLIAQPTVHCITVKLTVKRQPRLQVVLTVPLTRYSSADCNFVIYSTFENCFPYVCIYQVQHQLTIVQ